MKSKYMVYLDEAVSLAHLIKANHAPCNVRKSSARLVFIFQFTVIYYFLNNCFIPLSTLFLLRPVQYLNMKGNYSEQYEGKFSHNAMWCMSAVSFTKNLQK